VKSLSRIPPSLAEPHPRRKPAHLLRLYEFLLRAKITMALSTPWEGRKRQNATIEGLCSQLENLRERLRRGSGGLGVGRTDIGQGRIKRAVPEVLTNQEGIRALLNHQHGCRVLKYVRVL
jgi:hypothetical protein